MQKYPRASTFNYELLYYLLHTGHYQHPVYLYNNKTSSNSQI